MGYRIFTVLGDSKSVFCLGDKKIKFADKNKINLKSNHILGDSKFGYFMRDSASKISELEKKT